MSVRMIQDRLSDYGCRSALRQEEALTRAAFQGGTCLRIFHGLPKFPEDLDFALANADSGFQLGP
jgi:predicted nucleotidyltransferase component of viral defense system